MAVKLQFDERKWLLKCYWKVENIVDVQCDVGITIPTNINNNALNKAWFNK